MGSFFIDGYNYGASSYGKSQAAATDGKTGEEAGTILDRKRWANQALQQHECSTNEDWVSHGWTVKLYALIYIYNIYIYIHVCMYKNIYI